MVDERRVGVVPSCGENLLILGRERSGRRTIWIVTFAQPRRVEAEWPGLHAVGERAQDIVGVRRVEDLEVDGDSILGTNSPLSREAAFMLNNALFAIFTFTVLLGTVFPLLTEAIKGTKISVGEPYFNTMTIPT